VGVEVVALQVDEEQQGFQVRPPQATRESAPS
jgi:hypothetical protein